MKSMIDCDGVFEILTRAPFPTGNGCDEAVESHLGVCHECRQLAEALRPAVGLIHESLANSESLPEYDGRFATRVSACALHAQRLRQIGPFLAAGLAACLVFWVMHAATSPGIGKSGSSSHTAAILPGPAGTASLRALELPLACLAKHDFRAQQFSIEVAETPVISAEEVRFLCCTQCHRSGGNGPASERALRALNVACNACHKPVENLTACNLGIRDLEKPLVSFKSQITKSQITKSLCHDFQDPAAEFGQVVRLAT